MKPFSFDRLLVAALLLAWLPSSTSSTARGETWPAWMSSSSKGKEFDSQLSMARLNERHGKQDAAIKIYLSVLAKQPDNPLAHHRLAIISAKNGDFAKADQHFAQAMKMGAKNPELLADIGYALFLQNRFDEAEQSLRDTIQQFPGHKRARNTLGMAMGMKGEYQAALAEFRQVVGEAEAQANLAFVMVQTGNLEQASRHYHEAVKLNPKLRPAVEALVQLNEKNPAASTPPTVRTAAPVRKPTLAKPRRQAQSATMATPAVSSQPVAETTVGEETPGPLVENYVLNSNAEPAIVQPVANDGRQQANPIPQVAQPFAPQTPVVPTQAATSFAPAIQGLMQPDRLRPGIKATESAHDHMIARHEMTRKPAGSSNNEIAKAEKTASPASTTATASANSKAAMDANRAAKQDLFQSLAGEQAKSPATQQASTPADAVRAQVLNFDPPPSQAMAVDEAAPAPEPIAETLLEPATEEQAVAEEFVAEESIADGPVADEMPVVETATRLVLGGYALAAARAQARLLTKDAAASMETEPNPVHTFDARPIPLPPTTELTAKEAASPEHEQPIPTEISASEAISSPATFIIAPAAESLDTTAQEASKTSITNVEPSTRTTAATTEAQSSTTIGPWHIGFIAITSIVGFVTIAKSLKSVARRKNRRTARQAAMDAQPRVDEQPSETEAEHKYDLEQACTNLESTIREVRAGLSMQSNAGSQGKQKA